jgi:hypothetical protein
VVRSGWSWDAVAAMVAPIDRVCGMVLTVGMTNTLNIPRPSILNRLRRRTALRVTPWDDSYAECVSAIREHEVIAANLDSEGAAWIVFHPRTGDIALERGDSVTYFEMNDGVVTLGWTV